MMLCAKSLLIKAGELGSSCQALGRPKQVDWAQPVKIPGAADLQPCEWMCLEQGYQVALSFLGFPALGAGVRMRLWLTPASAQARAGKEWGDEGGLGTCSSHCPALARGLSRPCSSLSTLQT